MIGNKQAELIKAIKNHKCCGKSDGSSDGSESISKEVTIDDVVKFIHDEVKSIFPGAFPYTTWNSIPNVDDVDGGQICKSTNGDTSAFISITLNTPSYIIGVARGID